MVAVALAASAKKVPAAPESVGFMNEKVVKRKDDVTSIHDTQVSRGFLEQIPKSVFLKDDSTIDSKFPFPAFPR